MFFIKENVEVNTNTDELKELKMLTVGSKNQEWEREGRKPPLFKVCAT